MDYSSMNLLVGQKEEVHVLIADDETFNLQILKMMLMKSTAFTFNVKEAYNGKASLMEFLKYNNPEQP